MRAVELFLNLGQRVGERDTLVDKLVHLVHHIDKLFCRRQVVRVGKLCHRVQIALRGLKILIHLIKEAGVPGNSRGGFAAYFRSCQLTGRVRNGSDDCTDGVDGLCRPRPAQRSWREFRLPHRHH